MPPPTMLSRRELADELTDAGYRIAPQTLAKLASQGTGPPFSLWGTRCVYDLTAALQWAAERLRAKNPETAQ